MQTRVVDHSPSEPRLHRILYFLKYLRAMVLNLVWTVIALLVLVATGWQGLHFMADSAVKALGGQIEPRLAGRTPRKSSRRSRSW
jgi:hypothetical protein